MYQSLTLVGRLGGDPEARKSQSGREVTVFSLATERSYRDSEGQMHRETIWFRVSCFGRLGETVMQHLSKGSVVLVHGTLAQPQVYPGRNGRWRTTLHVRAGRVQFLPGGGSHKDTEAAPQQAAAGQAAAPRSDDGLTYGVEDLPF